MFSAQYHCGCCNQAVLASDKECQNCGSHNIKSPYGFWIFCVLTCLALAVTLKISKLYLADHQEVPITQSVLKMINDKNK